MSYWSDLLGENRENPGSSFYGLSEEDVDTHCKIRTYNSFHLTGAVAPSYDLKIVPSEGYKKEIYSDCDIIKLPVLIASVTRKKLFEVFCDLAYQIHGGQDGIVDVVLESSHEQQNSRHIDIWREEIDLSVLMSHLWLQREMLIEDGCTGVVILDPRQPAEVQFDEHKLLYVYGQQLRRFEEVLKQYGIPFRDDMKFITGAEHWHCSDSMHW